MTAQEYLSQARYLDMRIRSKIKQIEDLNDLATSTTLVLSDMPKSPSGAQSRMADAICKIVDLQAEINGDIDKLVDLKREIVGVIKAVDNIELQTLLEKRYLCYMQWEEIAAEMGYSMQHIFRQHTSALKKISVPLKDESKCD